MGVDILFQKSPLFLCHFHSFSSFAPKVHDLPVFLVYLVLRLIVVVSLVSAILRKEYESAFLCALVLVLFLVPLFVEHNFGIQLPNTLEIIILLFIFAAEILGELQCYFIQYPHWDTMTLSSTRSPSSLSMTMTPFLSNIHETQPFVPSAPPYLSK